MESGSTYFEIKKANSFIVSNLTFSNFSENPGSSTSTLFYLTKENSDSYVLEDISFQNVPLNLIKIDGLSSEEAILKQILIKGFRVENVEFEKDARLLEIGDYFTEGNVSIQI